MEPVNFFPNGQFRYWVVSTMEDALPAAGLGG